MNQAITTLEKENSSLKKQLSDLQDQFDKEQSKNRDLIPQYKASVARLQKNTQLIREKLKDIQELRSKEKKEAQEKVQNNMIVKFYHELD